MGITGKQSNISVGKVILNLIIPCIIIALAVSTQSNKNAVIFLITDYCLIFAFLLYLCALSNSDSGATSMTTKIIKWIPIVLIMATLTMLIIMISVNIDKITESKMPDSYYTFSMLTNIFLLIQISIIVTNFSSGEQNSIYMLSDKMAIISIIFGEFGLIMSSIILSIILYNSTQC